MTPPTFSNLGKSAKDLFDKGYTHGHFKLDVTSKSGPIVEFKSQAEQNLTTQKVKGNLEVKYKIPEYGTTITEKWNTDNQLVSIIELNNQLAKGVKVTLDTNYTPHNGKRGAVFKTDFSGQMVRICANMTLLGGPLFDVSGVTQIYNDWLVGGQAKFDMGTNEMKNACIAVSRKTSDSELHSYTNGREFGASLYNKMEHTNLEYGVQLNWKTDEQSPQFGFATKYQVNPDFCLRTKFDNKAQVSMAATHKLNEAAKLTISSHFGLAGVPETANKFGIGLEYAQ